MSENILAQVASIFSTGDIVHVRELFADTYIDHQKPDWIAHDGPEEFIKIVSSARNSLPNLAVTAGDVILDEDLIVGIMHWTSVSATAKVDRKTVETLRLENGKIIEHWGFEVSSLTRTIN